MGTVECPRLMLLMDGYGIDTENRSAGTEVAVTCYGRQLVTVKCEESGVWNGTIPPCRQDLKPLTDVSTVAQSTPSGDDSNLSTVVIIVWVLGGLLLMSLLILIVVIINSRKKSTGSAHTSNGSRSNIFSISHSGQSRGGDNPAFCRADERSSGDRPLQRNSPGRVSQTRPPSYQEVMSGRIITVPIPRSPNRSPPRSNNSAQGRGRHPREANRHDPEAARRGHQSSTLVTRPPRYAYEYPSCFWEEDPPPPYSVGNFGVVRAMGGGPRGASQERERNVAAENSIRNHSPIPGRAPLAVPTPTVLSPAPSPGPPPRSQHSTAAATAGQCPASRPNPPPSPLPGIHGNLAAAPPGNHQAAAREYQAPRPNHPPSPLPGLHGNLAPAPLASSSPVLPRHQHTLSAPPLVQVLREEVANMMSAGGARNGGPSPVMPRTRVGSCRGHAGYHDDARPSRSRIEPSAPLARLDCDYF